MNLPGRKKLRRGNGLWRGNDCLGAPEDELAIREAIQNRTPLASGGARAAIVNRTHRVVREQALHLQQQKQQTRDLWAPLTIVSILMIGLCYAIWCMADGYDLTPTGIPDASDQLMILLLWLLPVTAVVLGMVWLKRGRVARVGHNGEAQP